MYTYIYRERGTDGRRETEGGGGVVCWLADGRAHVAFPDPRGLGRPHTGGRRSENPDTGGRRSENPDTGGRRSERPDTGGGRSENPDTGGEGVRGLIPEGKG
jgi:hypothetical protein